MYFSEEDLEKIRQEHLSVPVKYQCLLLACAARNYNDPQAHEYATHGFSRRLKTLVRCIENVFEILPPDRIELPTKDELSDAAINIQAFVFNVFGCADNLAWVWVREKCLVQNNGSPIPKRWVGLRKKNEFVRRSFSQDFQEYLKGLDVWFENLENFRHALAHRIPLYIPPYIVSDDKMADYRQLEDSMAEASKRQDFAKYDLLSAEQEALGVFNPVMTHSFEEKSKVVVFHAQLLADFNTIEELGRKVFEELRR